MNKVQKFLGSHVRQHIKYLIEGKLAHEFGTYIKSGG